MSDDFSHISLSTHSFVHRNHNESAYPNDYYKSRHDSWPGYSGDGFVNDGTTWNHILITHKGTDRQTDRRRFQASKFIPTVIANVDDTYNDLTNGVVGVDDTLGSIITNVDSSSTLASGIIGLNSMGGIVVGDEIKIASDGTVAFRNAGVSLFVIGISTHVGSKITVSATKGGVALNLTTPVDWGIIETDEIYPVRFTIGDCLNITSADGETTRITGLVVDHSNLVRSHQFYVKSKTEIATGASSDTITLSKTDNKPVSLKMGHSNTEGKVLTLVFEHLKVGDKIAFVQYTNDVGTPEEKLSIDGIEEFYIVSKGNSTTAQAHIIVSATEGGADFSFGTFVWPPYIAIYLASDIELDTPGVLSSVVEKALPVTNLTGKISDEDIIYPDNSANEPGDKNSTGGVYNGDNTPGFTYYINKTTHAGDEFQGFMEWTKTDGDSANLLKFLGGPGESTLPHDDGLGLDNITIWNTYKNETEMEQIYNSGVGGDFVDSDCRVQITFDELIGPAILDGQALVNSGADPDKLAVIHQGPTTVEGGTMDLTVEGTDDSKLEWTIRKHQLDQAIELKEIDIKFGTMDNVEGRYGKEIEKDNA
jgi:hypothetical protein